MEKSFGNTKETTVNRQVWKNKLDIVIRWKNRSETLKKQLKIVKFEKNKWILLFDSKSFGNTKETTENRQVWKNKFDIVIW